MQDNRLLICDDEPAFGRFVQNVAEDLGYEVCVTTDGGAFIEAYKSFQLTVIILDMIMPGMDGVLFTTGYARETTRHKRGLHERAPWLLKPYSHQDLARELKMLLAPTVH